MAAEAPDVQALMRRLERVEQDLRWWKRLGGALAAVAILLAVVALLAQAQRVRPPVRADGARTLGEIGATIPEEIRAKRFVVVDAAGKERAELGPGPQAGSPTALRVYREDGSVGAVLFDLGLAVYGKEGIPRAEVTMTADGPSLRLSDVSERGSKARVSLAVPAPGGASLSLDGDSAVLALKGDKGGVHLFFDQGGRGPMLQLHDSADRVRVEVGLSGASESPGVILVDAKGNPRAVLGAAAIEFPSIGGEILLPESSLKLFDREGKVLWQAP